MITLYAAEPPNSMKVVLALEELELPYTVVPVDLMLGAQFEPAFLRLNPNAKVPVIIDDDALGGRPHTAFESGAILLYLADKTGRLIPQDPAGRSETVQWLMVQISTLGPMLGQFMHFARFAPPGNDYALARYRTQLRRVVDVFEARLAESEWIGGQAYGVADIAVFPSLRSLPIIFGPEVDKDYPKLLAWVGRIAARPAVGRADAVKAKLAGQQVTPDKMSPDMIDKVLGRGAYTRA
jgi:GST-like protein